MPSRWPSRRGTDTTVRVLAARHGLGAHGIRIFDDEGRGGSNSTSKSTASFAWRRPTGWPRSWSANSAGVPGLSRIVSHLEPVGDATATVRAEPAAQTQVRARWRISIASTASRWTRTTSSPSRVGGELQVSFHCRLGAATALTEAHELTVRLEEYLRGRIHNLGRVVIHVEPLKTSGRARSS